MEKGCDKCTSWTRVVWTTGRMGKLNKDWEEGTLLITSILLLCRLQRGSSSSCAINSICYCFGICHFSHSISLARQGWCCYLHFVRMYPIFDLQFRIPSRYGGGEGVAVGGRASLGWTEGDNLEQTFRNEDNSD